MSTTAHTLRIGLEKVEFRAPNQVTDDTSILTLKNLVLEPLLRWAPHGATLPGLFSHWEHTSDGREWRFSIRAGATFHDGKACVASDVTAFVDAILNSRDSFGMRWSYHRYLANASIEAVDERTVRVRNPEPCAWILDVFTDFFVCRVDRDGLPLLGTGRYKVVSYEAQKHAELESVRSSERYQRIVAIANTSAEARLLQLQRGETDAALNLERFEDLTEFDADLNWTRATNTLSVIFYLNSTHGIFAHPAARLAINHAIDTDRLIEEVFSGLAEPATTIASPFHLGAQEARLNPIPYDPAKARELFQTCGAEDLSEPLLLRTPTFMPERAEAISAFVAKSLEAVGLKVDVQVEPNRPEYARQVGLDKRIGDLALFDSSPNSTFRILDDKISSRTRAVWWQGYENAEVQSLIEEANGVVGEGRKEAYGKVLEALNRDPPWLYLVHPVVVLATRKGVEGVRVDHRGALCSS